SPSGGALRARIADAIKHGCTFLEGPRHAPQGTGEHLACQGFEYSRPESEIARKANVRSSIRNRLELPLIVQILERPFDVIHTNAPWLLFYNAAREALFEGVEPHDQVRHRLGGT